MTPFNLGTTFTVSVTEGKSATAGTLETEKSKNAFFCLRNICESELGTPAEKLGTLT